MTVEQVLDSYRAQSARANEILAATALDDAPAWWPEKQFGGWRLHSVREVALHVIAETACHAGHLDAVRELLDGRRWLVLADPHRPGAGLERRIRVSPRSVPGARRNGQSTPRREGWRVSFPATSRCRRCLHVETDVDIEARRTESNVPSRRFFRVDRRVPNCLYGFWAIL